MMYLADEKQQIVARMMASFLHDTAVVQYMSSTADAIRIVATTMPYFAGAAQSAAS